MSKRVIGRFVISIALIALAAFVYGLFESQESLIESGYYYWISGLDYEPNPNLLRDYPESNTGDYQFNPETIFDALNQGRTDVFTPLSVDLNDVNVEYDNIAWSQSDFLRVANALSQQVWHEPLDLENWEVYFILLEGNCNSSGLFSFEITYYKKIKTGWETEYTTRHIDLTPWMGMAEWAGDGDFSVPFIFGWRNVELTKFKVTAEQAVRIANENGGEVAYSREEEKCMVYVDIDENVNRNTGGNWLVDYWNSATSTSFYAFIDPFTGQYHSAK